MKENLKEKIKEFWFSFTTQKDKSTTQKTNGRLVSTTQKDESTTQKSDLLPKRKLCDSKRADKRADKTDESN